MSKMIIEFWLLMTASNKNLPTYLEKVSCLNNSFWWHVHNLHMKRLEAVCTFFRIRRHILHCIFCVCCERLDWQNVIIFTFDVWVLVYHILGCPVLAPFGTLRMIHFHYLINSCNAMWIWYLPKDLSAFLLTTLKQIRRQVLWSTEIIFFPVYSKIDIIYYLVYLNNKYILPLLSIIIYYIPSKYITILMGIILHKNVNLMNFLFKLF